MRLRDMKNFASILAVLLLVACSIGVTVHDESRAAELVVNFLSSIKTATGINPAYEWTDDEFKAEVPLNEFLQSISTLRSKNSGAEIRLVGHETFGPEEVLIVYAESVTSNGSLHFKFSLVGTKHKDYYLINFDVNDVGFPKKGIYREYGKSIIIHGV